jgi:SAM-dependent methyltransferase
MTDILPFSQQNIVLPDGTETLPGETEMAKTPWMAAYLRSLAFVFRDRTDRSQLKVADIGCLEGVLTAEFAKAGYDATGIEIRSINLARCQYVAEKLGLANLHFEQEDARNIAAHEPFDAVFCSGLLYHLDRPVAFLHDVAKVTRRALILETHFATGRRSPNWRLYRPWLFSRMVTNEGVRGRWFREYAKNSSQERIETSLWSSWGNPRSFWIEKRHLVQSLRDAGFSTVYEQYDFLDNNLTDPFIQERNRTLFVALKD